MRKLRKCPCCGEWFNTTAAIMSVHYERKHKHKFDKAFALAELVVKKAILLEQSRLAPFPQSMMLAMSAGMVQGQIDLLTASLPLAGTRVGGRLILPNVSNN